MANASPPFCPFVLLPGSGEHPDGPSVRPRPKRRAAPRAKGESNGVFWGEASLACSAEVEAQSKNESSWDHAAEKQALTSSFLGL